ncbi:DUF402 domain-containing protein [Actinosynnema sp. NPDC023587]|uniref:DUF402 domain-containing protein n=1 Tax=Actinosynnema sp. NPDC023587 TaxID=3154695 RepID=UPI003410C381
MGFFAPGDVALRREVLHGRPWAVTPTRVVADGPDLLAVFTVPGTRFGFPPHPFPHHWQTLGRTRWNGHGKLQLHRPGDAYSVDHELDYWVPVDGPWSDRDREEFELQVAEGKYTAEQGDAIRRTGKEIEAMLDGGTTWWDPAWSGFTADPDLPAPDLPAGWEDYPLP